MNLDQENRLKLLTWIGFDEESLAYPKIDFIALRAELIKNKYIKNTDTYEEQVLRMLALTHKLYNHWEFSPHALEFIDLFVLFAFNTSMDGKGFSGPVKSYFIRREGETYGSVENWSELWQNAPTYVKEGIVRGLFKYRN